MAKSADIKTPLATIAFAHNLFEPQTRDNGKSNYGCSLLFPKDLDIGELKAAAVNAAVEEWGDKAKQMIKDEIIKSPFLDGDGKQGLNKQTSERHPGFAGTTFIRCVSGADYKPKVFDKNRNPVFEKDGCRSGSKVYAVINAFTWENKENGKGVSFGISMAQVVKNAEGDEILGGRGPSPDKFFEKIEDDEGDTGSVAKGGDGAASLFG